MNENLGSIIFVTPCRWYCFILTMSMSGYQRVLELGKLWVSISILIQELNKHQRTCSDLTQPWRPFWPFFTKKRIFTIWSKYVDSNMSPKYVFHEKNVFRSEKTRFLAKKVIFYHKSLLYQMSMRIYWKDIWLK